MAKGFLHLHVTLVVLFTLVYAVKVYLLLANKTQALDTLRAKTKIADMIFGTLIIITGGYLTYKAPVIETYLIVKIILVIISIPIGIIAMKKLNKPMAVTALLIYVYVFAVAKTDSLVLKKDAYISPVNTEAAERSPIEEGKVIYTSQCAVCHGADGALKLNDAKDLSVSTLNHSEIVEQTKNGKGLMPGFKDQLNEKQLQAVAEYVESLKK